MLLFSAMGGLATGLAFFGHLLSEGRQGAKSFIMETVRDSVTVLKPTIREVVKDVVAEERKSVRHHDVDH